MPNRIREFLEKKGWTQRDLSTAVDCSEFQINSYVNGRQSPRLELALKIARALDTTVEELFQTPSEIVN